jgi:cytochrome P450
MQDTVLQSGITIPKDTADGLSLYDAHTDLEIQDIGPNGIPLTELDPLRFVGKRSKTSTSVGTDSLTFGVGHHSCPGCYFASQEIKILTCLYRRQVQHLYDH